MRYESLANDYREQIKRSKGLKGQINKLKIQTKNETTQTLVKYKNTASELSHLKSQNASYKKQIAGLNARIKKIEKTQRSNTEKILNQKIYSYLLKGSPKQVAMSLKSDVYLNNGENEKLYQEKLKWLEKLNTIYLALTNSGTKYSGIAIDDENKIVMIEAGEVHYNNSGAIRTTKWTELPLETSLLLAKGSLELEPSKDDSPAAKQKELELDSNLKAYITLLKGNLAMTLKQNPSDKNVLDICNATLEQRLNRIKYMATIDKAKARARLKLILKQLEGTEAGEKTRKDFSDLLIEESNFWNEETGN
jgi:hypothetical protein